MKLHNHHDNLNHTQRTVSLCRAVARISKIPVLLVWLIEISKNYSTVQMYNGKKMLHSLLCVCVCSILLCVSSFFLIIVLIELWQNETRICRYRLYYRSKHIYIIHFSLRSCLSLTLILYSLCKKWNHLLTFFTVGSYLSYWEGNAVVNMIRPQQKPPGVLFCLFWIDSRNQ